MRLVRAPRNIAYGARTERMVGVGGDVWLIDACVGYST